MIPAICAIATMIFASCNDITPQIEEKEYDYSFDIGRAVSCNYFEGSAAGTAVTVKADLPFESTVLSSGSNYSCENAGRPEFVIVTDEIETVKVDGKALSLSRDVLVHIRPLEICRIKGFDYFNYPVLIRQRGDDGTMYLSKDEIQAYKADKMSCSNWIGNCDQHYIKGKVVSIGAVTPFDGVPANNGLFVFPLAPGQNSMYSKTPWNLDAVELTLDVEGESIPLKAIYEKPYGLVLQLAGSVKSGDTVEVNVSARGILDGYDGIFVHPLTVRKL